MRRKPKKDPVEWHSCHCGCCGQETIYKGRYFWKTHNRGGHYLFGGPKAHRGGNGFHVGEDNGFFRSLDEVDDAVRKYYKKYEKLPSLGWHPCGCNKPDLHFIVCLKELRFYGKWHENIKRFELYFDHSCDSTRGFYKQSKLDSIVRNIARRPRRPKRGESGAPATEYLSAIMSHEYR